MKGLILSAGKGKRLRPLTHTGPKHLIPLVGKPVMQYCLEDLIEAGINDIGIVVSYMKEKIMDYFGNGEKFGARITYITQEPPLGIAHAIKTAENFIGDSPFVVYLGDNILKGGISSYIKEFESSDYDTMILLTEVEDPTQFGVAKIENGKLVKLVEKPKIPPSKYALVGVYFFRSAIFRAIENIKPSWRGELEITDAIQWLIDHGYHVEYRIIEGWWKDTGKPKDILEALYLILDDIKRCINGKVENSEIFGRVYIGDNSLVVNSIVRGPVYIGNNVTIEDAIIGPYTSIEDNVKIKGGEVLGSLILSNSTIQVTENTRITDSIIGNNCIIKNRKRGLKLILGEHCQVFI